MNAIDFYRASNWLHRRKVPVLPKIIHRVIFFLYNSDIPPGCTIGRGTKCNHGGVGVVIHRDCHIGDGCIIGMSVTLGGSFGPGVPMVGDNVWMAPGSRIFGPVRIGNNVIIGANSVITRDVPDNSVVMGIPGRVVKQIAPGALNALNGTLEKGIPVEEQIREMAAV